MTVSNNGDLARRLGRLVETPVAGEILQAFAPPALPPDPPIDGAPGLEKVLATLWSDLPVQRCMANKHRDLLAAAPDRLNEEISADCNNMISADSQPEIEAKRKAFIREWRLKCRAVATAWRRPATSCSPSRGSRKASGNRSARRTRSWFDRLTMRVCTKSSTSDQDPDRIAVGGNRGDVILGFAGYRPDRDAQSGWLAKPRRKAIRSGD